MPRYYVSVDGRYALETEVEAENEDEAIARADFGLDVSVEEILQGGTWQVLPVEDDE